MVAALAVETTPAPMLMSKRCLWAKMAMYTLIARVAASRFVRVVSECLAVALISQGNRRWTQTLAGCNVSSPRCVALVAALLSQAGAEVLQTLSERLLRGHGVKERQG